MYESQSSASFFGQLVPSILDRGAPVGAPFHPDPCWRESLRPSIVGPTNAAHTGNYSGFRTAPQSKNWPPTRQPHRGQHSGSHRGFSGTIGTYSGSQAFAESGHTIGRSFPQQRRLPPYGEPICYLRTTASPLPKDCPVPPQVMYNLDLIGQARMFHYPHIYATIRRLCIISAGQDTNRFTVATRSTIRHPTSGIRHEV